MVYTQLCLLGKNFPSPKLVTQAILKNLVKHTIYKKLDENRRIPFSMTITVMLSMK